MFAIAAALDGLGFGASASRDDVAAAKAVMAEYWAKPAGEW
jgi:hypothetical protein